MDRARTAREGILTLNSELLTGDCIYPSASVVPMCTYPAAIEYPSSGRGHRQTQLCHSSLRKIRPALHFSREPE